MNNNGSLLDNRVLTLDEINLNWDLFRTRYGLGLSYGYGA